jgi:hypothetical protein
MGAALGIIAAESTSPEDDDDSTQGGSSGPSTNAARRLHVIGRRALHFGARAEHSAMPAEVASAGALSWPGRFALQSF